MITKQAFTPPIVKNRIVLLAVSLSLVLLTGCSTSSGAASSEAADTVQEETAQDPEAVSIVFRDCAWGLSLEDITSAVVSADMQAGTDYETGEESEGVTGLALYSCTVGGYEAQASFICYDDSFSMGIYNLTIDEGAFSDLLPKYTEQYGEPVVQEDSTGWGPCAVWVDAEKNYICISDFLDQILYISSECPYTDTLSGIMEKYHGVDLQGTLEKVGNTEGI